MSEIAFEINSVSKRFFGIYALNNINIQLEKGKITGLVGENGAGKSTLMNIIGGVHQCDEGSMVLFGNKYKPQSPVDAIANRIAFVHQELNLFPNLSIADNMFIERYPGKVLIKRSEMRKKTREMLATVELSLSPETLVEKLSPGQKQLVEIAKCMRTDPDIVIFDEPTTSLTANEAERLFSIIEKIKSAGKTIIYISHTLSDILKLTDHLVVLRDGKVTDTGETKDFTMDRIIKSMVGRSIEQLFPERISKPTEEIVLEARGVSEPGIVHDISFSLRKGEILGIFGLMGSGRTELIRMLFGLETFSKGTVLVNNVPVKKSTPEKSIKMGIGLVSEDRKEEGLLLNHTVAENLSLVALPAYSANFLGVVDNKKQKGPMGEHIAKLKIKTGNIEKVQAKSLSGGNQQKVVIAKWLMQNPSILFVDEPTRGIDVGAKYEVYSILDHLAAEGKSILMVSSEIEELMGVCDRVLVMSKGEIYGEFDCSEFDSQKILSAAFRKSDAESKECSV